MNIGLIFLLQTVATQATAVQEAWFTTERNFQHRTGGEVHVVVGWPHFEAEGWTGMGFWGRHNSKIAGSFLNAETPRVWERSHGGAARVLYKGCGGGVWVGRRAVQWIGVTLRWPGGVRGDAQAGIDELLAGNAPTIGYHDEVRGQARCQLGSVRAEYLSPGWRWHSVTLPHYDHAIKLGYDTDRGQASIHAEAGGLRNAAIDVHTSVFLSDALAVGFRAGTVAYPGWEAKPLFRMAAALEVR